MSGTAAIPVVLMTPVYDKNMNWVGLRLDGGKGQPLTAPVVAAVLQHLQGIELFSYQSVFLSYDPSLAKGNSLPPTDQTVVMLPSMPEEGNPAAKVAAVLTGKGFRVAAPGLPKPAQREMLTIAVMQAAAARKSGSEEALAKVAQSGFRLFADQVNSLELFDWCAANNFHYISCGAMPYVPTAKAQAQGPSKEMLMRLLDAVTRDAAIGDLEDVFKQEPKLAFDLLRLVNSASMGLRNKIANFRQAITILGRRQLQRWLQLLVFSHQKDSKHGPNVLMLRAATRGRMMEQISKQTPEGGSTDYQEEAFMVGAFSMLDVLMNSPLDELLKNLQLAEAVEQALLHREGDFGQMLTLVEQAEARDAAGVQSSLERLGIPVEVFNDIQAETLGWVFRMREAE